MSEEKNRDELKNTKENDRDQAVPEVSESENASDTDNKNSDPGAKETSSRKKSDKAVRIISDNKNAGAAFAGANADVPSGAPDIDSAVPGDDILEIIRRRKAADGNSGTAPDAASSGNEAGDMFDIEELNHEVGATVSRNTDTKIMDRKTLSGTDKKTDPEMKRTITVDPENNEAAKGEVSEDLRRTLAVEVSEDGLEVKKVREKNNSKGKASSGKKDGGKTSKTAEDAVETRDVDIEDFFYQEKPEKELTAEEKAKYENRGLDGKGSETEPGSRGLESDKPAAKPGKKGSGKKKDNTKNNDDTDGSDLLLEELTAGEDGDDADDKRYGFKPYTREIRSMEIAEAAEKAAAEKEANSIRGKVKRMATKKKKPTSSASKSSGSKASGTSQKKSGSSGSGSSGKSKAARNSKTLANGKMSKNTAAYKLTDLQEKSGKKKNGGGKSRKSQKRPRKKQKKWVGFFRAFFRTIIVFVLIAVLAGTGYAAYVISHAPTIHPRNIYDTLDVSSHIYDDEENLIDEIYFSENRELATYEQLPENLKNAFIAVEDKTFWTHSGFNFRRIIGAILERFHGGRISGTSTITQQLARNVFLPEDKSVRSIKRKIIEMYYAYQIEQELSKEHNSIPEYHLSRIRLLRSGYSGQNVFFN